MSQHTHPIDIGDDVLVRILDGQASDQECVAFENAGGGSTASTRHWELKESSERFSEAVSWLPVPDLPPMPARSSGPRMLEIKAAVIALLLLSGAAAAMPGPRALVIDAAQTVVTWITGASAAPIDVEVEPGRTRVSFVPEGTVFALAVEFAQGSGSIVIERASGAEVTALAAPDAELLVMPGALLVRNRPESGEDVVISVPASVVNLELRVGGIARAVSLDGDRPRLVIPMR